MFTRTNAILGLTLVVGLGFVVATSARPAYAQVATPPTTTGADVLRQTDIILDRRYSQEMIVELVTPDSPADRAGLRPGDLIANINGIALRLQVERNGLSRPVDVIAGQAPVRTEIRYIPDPMVRAEIVPPVVTTLRPIAPVRTVTSAAIGPSSGSPMGAGVGGSGSFPEGPGTPGLGSAPPEGGGSAAMRTGRNAPVMPSTGWLPPRQ